MKDVKFIKDCKSNNYYLVEDSKIEKITLPIKKIIGVAAYREGSMERLYKGGEYDVHKLIIHDKEALINPVDADYKVGNYDYVTDEILLDKLKKIYEEYLKRETIKPDVTNGLDIKIDEYDYVHAMDLTQHVNKYDPFFKISLHSLDPADKREKYNL